MASFVCLLSLSVCLFCFVFLVCLFVSSTIYCYHENVNMEVRYLKQNKNVAKKLKENVEVIYVDS